LKGNSDYEHLTIFSDAGFKKEELDGYALRGAVYIRHTEPIFLETGKPVGNFVNGHILLADSRSIKTVCRSTYAAELLSATSATDIAIPLTVTLYELRAGPLGTERLRSIRDHGWMHENCIRTSIFLDAKPDYESLRATTFKPPVEHSLSGHVLWLREMHDKGLVSDIIWTDTRDMYADGLTKGVIKRDALHELMNGKLMLRHDVAVCKQRYKPNMHATREHEGYS
jgi:hypothetical protein